MQTFQLLALQFLLSLAAYAAIGGWFVLPRLQRKPLRTAIMILVLPQLFRHVGVNLLVNQVVNPGLPVEFAHQTAIGDAIVVALAWFTLISLRGGWRFSITAAWLFNIIGLADLFTYPLRLGWGSPDILERLGIVPPLSFRLC